MTGLSAKAYDIVTTLHDMTRQCRYLTVIKFLIFILKETGLFLLSSRITTTLIRY